MSTKKHLLVYVEDSFHMRIKLMSVRTGKAVSLLVREAMADVVAKHEAELVRGAEQNKPQ
jgi:hypothetical protein